MLECAERFAAAFHCASLFDVLLNPINGGQRLAMVPFGIGRANYIRAAQLISESDGFGYWQLSCHLHEKEFGRHD